MAVILAAWLLAPVTAPAVSAAPASSGLATWYDDGPGLYAAVPSWRYGDTPYRVRVCTKTACVVVVVRDFCACPGDRVIDLSPSAFGRLGQLSIGVLRVTVAGLATLPPTDTEAK